MYNLKFDLALNRKENVIYKNVKIDFKNGDIINIVGKNGCGKCTFCKMLTGKVKPENGIISSAITDNTAVVSDCVSLPREVLIKDIFKLMGNNKVKYVNQTYPDIYEYILQIKHKGVRNLSISEQRILEIFCALSTQKGILALYEIENGLDSENKKLITDQLRLISNKNKAVIFNTTQCIEDAFALGGRIYIMNKEKALFKEYIHENCINDSDGGVL